VLADAVPGTWGVEGFIRMNTNGASLAQVSVEYRNLWILAAIYLTAGYLVQRFVQRPDIEAAARRLENDSATKS